MVNRLWQHHFGVGIVATPSDFGVMGEPPTHPELLDWLAVEFMESGWSLKHMHRLMVLSAAYCQDSHVDPKTPVARRRWKLTATNHLLWHARRRRLEGEAVRDAMLAVSGELNPRMFGVSARPKLPDASAAMPGRPTPSRRTRIAARFTFSPRGICVIRCSTLSTCRTCTTAAPAGP